MADQPTDLASNSQKHNTDSITTSTTTTKSDEKPLLAEIKNGKAVLKQKPISYEKNSETLQELVAFREMLEENSHSPLTTFPDAHKPLVSKLAHESDKTLSALIKHIVHELVPEPEDEDDAPATAPISSAILEEVIKTSMSRNNYGLDAISGVKPPANLLIWRWEVLPELSHYLPKNAREKAETRRKERVEAKQQLIASFQSLPTAEQEKLFGTKSGGLKIKHYNTPTGSTLSEGSPAELGQEGEKAAVTPKKSHGTENSDSTQSASKAQSKKQVDPTKAVKEQARLDKKNAKAEKDKKEEESQRKARSMMNNFFTKPRTTVENPTLSPSKPVQSDFEKGFKPFLIRKHVDVAPTNSFLQDSRSSSSAKTQDVIVIDDDEDDIVMAPPSTAAVSAGSSTASITALHAQVDQLRQAALSSSEVFPSGSSASHRTSSDVGGTSVRDIYTQLSEAEVSGDVSLVRSLHRALKDRSALPAKVLVFADDSRPGYFGTWTKTSSVIKPRKPLVQDVLNHDYGYDSGEDWEEEGEGDVADGVEDDEPEPEPEDADSELDDWLVDDDDDLDARSVSSLTHSGPSQKRKAAMEDEKAAKKRKVVVPLVPFVKGSNFEPSVESCSYAPFRAYQIRLFNDTPLPIDPFSFVSTCVEKAQSQRRTVSDAFTVPELPKRLESAPQATEIAGSASIPVKKSLSAPKTSFPDEHLPYLLKKIEDLRASSFPLLVENIYQELRTRKVKKNAIEAKIKEVAEKSKVEKIWMVKQVAF